ncbi:zinc ribbon domain-containing protein [Corticibacter populi]|uniref:Zinc ribbon domain-containing protein n=1 Tax=Corticibacter populi TaxID=1550736 RepID=A0A3M6QRY3_9BURK|nr:FmdB family zinc ribbon protein [Corticibacter populi]RMX05804.1 zinc ribbon domain-containing protein [Corticibacter populi]RZS30886.1 putative FmdB family regulatory protein [Corticibacter populi]
MPIYAYLCNDCGFRKDVLQKISDAPLTVCPACAASTFAKQLSAPSFQLKGTGWYATDFKNSGSKPGAPVASSSGGGDDKGASSGAAAPAASEAASSTGTGEKTGSAAAT